VVMQRRVTRKRKRPMPAVVALSTPDELRQFIRQTLCDHDRLDFESSPFLEGPLKRGGRICGIYFEVQGPRLMRSHALWVGEEHRILFYDSTGARFSEVKLSEAPDPRAWTEQPQLVISE
jgi:hypothetical protein